MYSYAAATLNLGCLTAGRCPESRYRGRIAWWRSNLKRGYGGVVSEQVEPENDVFKQCSWLISDTEITVVTFKFDRGQALVVTKDGQIERSPNNLAHFEIVNPLELV